MHNNGRILFGEKMNMGDMGNDTHKESYAKVEDQVDGGRITAIILAAGKGSRMRSDIPKQFMILKDYPVLYYSLKAFQESPVDDIVLVAGEDSVEYCRKDIVDRYNLTKVSKIVAGGAERYDSVHNGLIAADGARYVLIHDGARPCITQKIIRDSIDAVKVYSACTVGVPVKDTIKIVDGNQMGVETPDRSRLWQVQTPQSFDRGLLLTCYDGLAHDKCQVITDDTMIVERYSSVRTKVIMGAYENLKITTPEDLKIASNFLKKDVDTKMVK